MKIIEKLLKVPRFVSFKIKSILDSILIKTGFNGWAFSRLYYGVFNTSFDRETQSVLAGKQEYFRKNGVNGGGTVLLRRNIHRIEKGLSMKDRREIFALDYIEETVTHYCELFKQQSSCESKSQELRWFGDVLWSYFNTCKGHQKIERCREAFKQCFSEPSSPILAPFVRDVSNPLKCNMEALEELMERRRSVRWYTKERVSRDLIERAVRVASQAPSACNRQPFSFRVFDDAKEAEGIASLAGGSAGYAYQIPCLIAVIGHLDAYFSDRDRHIIYIDASLASMALIQAFECQGLGSCVINWPDVEDRERKMEKRLKLRKWERPIMLISVGVPDLNQVVPRSVKKSTKSLIQWEN